MVLFIKSYLIDRFQVVKVRGGYSSAFLATSGVSQGSNLGPLLFIIYMNDIKMVFKNSLFLLYADDLKCYKLISPENPCQDKNKLQTDIDCLSKWCENNLMPINMNKSSIISFSKR